MRDETTSKQFELKEQVAQETIPTPHLRHCCLRAVVIFAPLFHNRTRLPVSFETLVVVLSKVVSGGSGFPPPDCGRSRSARRHCDDARSIRACLGWIPVFGKDHAQATHRSKMLIQPEIILL